MNAAVCLDSLADRFAQFVHNPSHPCAMAKSVVSHKAVEFGVYDSLGTESAAKALCRGLYDSQHKPHGRDYWSYVAFFPNDHISSEEQFESRLWMHLQLMHEFDASLHDWDPAVSSDPQNPRFSFSIGGHGWYVIGLHPRSSRLARQLDCVALVFNPHAQFDELRARGKYNSVRNLIRERDLRLQGSTNPMLADHGESSEARQYSGRAVSDGWKCPFHVLQA